MLFQQFLAEKKLDISIIGLKDLSIGNRLDSDFYRPEYILLEKLSQNVNFCSFKRLWIRVDASAFYPSIEPLYNTWTLPFLRVANIDSNVKYDEATTIPEEIPNIYTTIKVGNPWDIVITKWWTVARIWFLTQRSALSRDLILIPSSHLKDYEKKFLYIYLITNHSNKLILKTASLTAQPHLTLNLIKDHPIFFPNDKFQQSISEFFDKVEETKSQAKTYYQQAEQLLLRELGLENYQPSEDNISIKDSNEIGTFSRMDAEFFQPKYDEIIGKIKEYEWWRDALDNLIEISDEKIQQTGDKIQQTGEKIQQTGDKIFQYVELADIDASNWLVNDFTEIERQDLPSRAQMKIRKNDVVLSSVAWSCSKIALITSNADNLVASTGFFILRSKFFNPETNLILMKSWVYQEFLKRTARGMILEATNKDDFKKYILPKVDKNVQEKIADLVSQSHKARNESKKLLEVAKRAVEVFIEEDEEKAMKFISKNA